MTVIRLLNWMKNAVKIEIERKLNIQYYTFKESPLINKSIIMARLN